MYNLTMQECRSWRLFWTVFQEHRKIFPQTHNTFISWWCRNFSVCYEDRHETVYLCI